MNILRNKVITDNISGTQGKFIEHEYYENDFFKMFFISDIYNILNADIISPVFRLYFLDNDENIIKDISDDFINGSLQCTYQSGTRRTLSIDLVNSNYQYTDNTPLLLSLGKKLRLDTGIVINNDIYWFHQGVFVVKDPSITANDSTQTISLSLSDKFSMFDGTVFGNTEVKTILPTGVPMKQAFVNILTADKGNGEPFDKKPLLFNAALSDVKTQKTIKLDFGGNLGDILLDSAKTISCDVFYNVYGNMTVESNVPQLISGNSPVLFRINDENKILRSSSMVYNWSKLRNKVIVKGAIQNGYQFSSYAENGNFMSPFFRGNNGIGVRAEVISNNKLYSDTLCKEQAMYSLIERQRGVKSLSLECGYIPFLDVNRSVLVTLSAMGLRDANFIVDSFSMNISNSPSVNISLSNTSEVIF